MEMKILLLLEYQSSEYRHIHHADGPPRVEHVILTSAPEVIKGKIRGWINSSESLDEENRQIAERLRDEGYIVMDVDWGDNIVEFIDPYEERAG